MKNQANMAAAHSAPTTLAVERLRRRKSRSGMSGLRTRDSIRRKTAASTAAAASKPSVRAERHPASLPLTMA